MYISRTLMLGLVLALIAFPVLTDWLTSDFSAWYRPYIVWTLLILFTWWGNRSRQTDEL
ncbi:hypothetical protein [Pseudohalioglobus sediminis]|uniref:hypothetical protein n=1 Tax=Pseudohalioglobus sediminis TaxID=2606449 RepID=UPI00165EE51B|nr:hypothetical protein [Pseudohalioglobus sediminis]